MRHPVFERPVPRSTTHVSNINKYSSLLYEPFIVFNVTTLSLPFLFSLQLLNNIIIALSRCAVRSVWMLMWMWNGECGSELGQLVLYSEHTERTSGLMGSIEKMGE
jgi:hypothetical protein